MNWESLTPIIQTTTDGRYAVKFGVTGWGAFDTSLFAKPRELGVSETDLRARAVCEDHERALITARQIA